MFRKVYDRVISWGKFQKTTTWDDVVSMFLAYAYVALCLLLVLSFLAHYDELSLNYLPSTDESTKNLGLDVPVYQSGVIISVASCVAGAFGAVMIAAPGLLLATTSLLKWAPPVLFAFAFCWSIVELAALSLYVTGGLTLITTFIALAAWGTSWKRRGADAALAAAATNRVMSSKNRARSVSMWVPSAISLILLCCAFGLMTATHDAIMGYNLAQSLRARSNAENPLHDGDKFLVSLGLYCWILWTFSALATFVAETCSTLISSRHSSTIVRAVMINYEESMAQPFNFDKITLKHSLPSALWRAFKRGTELYDHSLRVLLATDVVRFLEITRLWRYLSSSDSRFLKTVVKVLRGGTSLSTSFAGAFSHGGERYADIRSSLPKILSRRESMSAMLNDSGTWALRISVALGVASIIQAGVAIGYPASNIDFRNQAIMNAGIGAVFGAHLVLETIFSSIAVETMALVIAPKEYATLNSDVWRAVTTSINREDLRN